MESTSSVPEPDETRALRRPLPARLIRFSPAVLLLLAIPAIRAIRSDEIPIEAQESWMLDPDPVLQLGAAGEGETFGTVVGATRLPDGSVVVGERAEQQLEVFSPTGEVVRRISRRGRGPGELIALARVQRCGAFLVTEDTDGQRISLFDAAGGFKRSFRFESPQVGRPPYASVCNAAGMVLHRGWEERTDARGGVHRARVPFWTSRLDSAVGTVIGHLPGSERFGIMAGGRLHATAPFPLGAHPAMAISRDRIYIGAATEYAIDVYDFTGRKTGTIRKRGIDLATTPADVEHARRRELLQVRDAQRTALEKDFAAMPVPKTVPAYAAFVVDTEENLWVQDYPRPRSSIVRWTVFDPQGREITELMLPQALEVFEIGSDYVLGRFLPPDESVARVHMYRLRRSGE